MDMSVFSRGGSLGLTALREGDEDGRKEEEERRKATTDRK
jgi:hypothetical protein